MRIQVCEASPKQLNYLVAQLHWATEEWRSDGPFLWDGKPCIREGGHDIEYRPALYWNHGGPLIEGELIDVQAKFNSGSNIVPKGQWYWQASTVNEDDVAYWFDGPTPLIAAMRCFVASRLGDEVEVPDELT